MTTKELNELNSIKYKSNLKSFSSSNKLEEDLNNLDIFLEEEKKNIVSESWGKMDKNEKLKKLLEFAQMYMIEKDLNQEKYDKLVNFLSDCVEKKRLNKTRDVIFVKKTGIIKNIPGLMVNKQNNFTIKNLDSKTSTIRCLNTKKTIKKTHPI